MGFSELSDAQRNRFYECISNNVATGKPTIEEIAAEFQTTTREILDWKKQALDVATVGIHSDDDYYSVDDKEEESDYEEEPESISGKLGSLLDRERSDHYNEPLSDTFKERLWIVVGIACAVAVCILLYKPVTSRISTISNKSKATPETTEVANKEQSAKSKATPKTTIAPTATPALTASIKLKADSVEIDYGTTYDPTSNIQSVSDNLGQVVNYVSDKKDGKGWYYVTSSVDGNKEGTQKVTVEVYYNKTKTTSQTFDVVVKPKPTPTPTPTPKPAQTQPVQKQTQPAQSKPAQVQPAQQPQSQPVQDDENVDISQFGDGTESYNGHDYN